MTRFNAELFDSSVVDSISDFCKNVIGPEAKATDRDARAAAVFHRKALSEMGIMGDILGVTMDGGRSGVIISAISRKANLSHYAVLDKCEKLVTAGLVESVKNDRNRVYLMTEKGVRFFQEFQRFQSLVESMNLRY